MERAFARDGIGVAAAPVSWGVFEHSEDDPLQLAPEEMLDQMATGGYAGTELGPPGYLGDAAALRTRLQSRDLSLVGAFLPQRFSRSEHAADDRARMCEVLDLMNDGQPDDVRPKCILADASVEPERMRWAGQIPEHPEARLDGARFNVMVDNLHRAGEAARERDYDPVLHFHAGSYIETAGEIHAVMKRLDTSLVGMCLDTGHARFGGADPIELLAQYGDVVRHVHVKDCDLGVLDVVPQDIGDIEEPVTG
jgi:inosose dehydratase